MNFVKLYIGDYMRDTGTLTLAEHGAYMLMLMHHCATEQPLPTGRELHRLLRAESKLERDAAEMVAARYWKAVDGGLVNNRAGEEMKKAEHQREVNRIVGKLGGRPKRTETESVCEPEPNTNPNHSHSQTPKIKDNPLPLVEGSGAALCAAPPTPPPAFDGTNSEILNGKAVVQISAAFTIPAQWGIDAEALGFKPSEVLREGEKFRQYWVDGRGKGTRRSVKGWRQSWSNWLEKAARNAR